MTWTVNGKKTGSTTGWRKTRARILLRDQYQCQIRGPKCTGRATQVHHVLGKEVSEKDEDLKAVCMPCNNAIGDPTKKDPAPVRRTEW